MPAEPVSAQPFSVETARRAARADRLDWWVGAFLASPGSDNAPLAAKLAVTLPHWLGPVEIPHEQLHRLAGPPGAPVLEAVPEDEWRDDVEDLAEKIEDDGHEPPPVIASYRQGRLVVEDGNHRIEALRRAGYDVAWAIVGFETEGERRQFIARAGSVDPS
jgi:hypothetical protein